MHTIDQPAVLGFRSHSGWAVVVAVGGSASKPVVLERRRIETADAAIAGSKQPYHACVAHAAADGPDILEAETLIRRCRDSSARLATEAVSAMVARLAENGHRVVGAGIFSRAGRPLPDLAATLRSHALLHTAEGDFFRDVLVQASERCSLPVTRMTEREVWERGVAALGLGAAELQRVIGELGRSLGPPWRQEEKLASLAAWIALAESVVNAAQS